VITTKDFKDMKKVNKDYIGVVRRNNGRLQYERIPMQKSVKVMNKLVSMAEDDMMSIEDMTSYVHSQIVFQYLALPFSVDHESNEMYDTADWVMKELVDDLMAARTKVKYLECALKVLEECDYRWNAIRIDNTFPDLLVRTHRDYETEVMGLGLTKDTSILFQSYDLGSGNDGGLFFTVYKNEVPLLPYRSVVEMYDCSEDILDTTMMFDPESNQWDNALRSLVAISNAILENEDEFYKKHVVEAGQEMLEKMKLLCLDPKSYYTWLENIQDRVSIDYSECGKSLDPLLKKDESNRRLYELLETGRKMTCALDMADNLLDWSKEGLMFSGLEKIQTDLQNISKSLLQEMEKEHDNLPEEVFSEDYGEYESPEEEKGEIARELRCVCDKLREWLSLEPRFPEEKDEF
jgi:hypothetical protein